MWKKVKVFVLYVLGLVFGAISIYGCYPLGIGYYAAMLLQPFPWYSIIPIVLAGMIVTAPIVSVVKYAVAMLLCTILSGLVTIKRGSCKRGEMAWIAGGSLFAMNFTEYYLLEKDWFYLYYGGAETVVVICLVLFFDQVLGWLEQKGYTGRYSDDATAMLDVGRERLKESAKVLAKLSQCFEEMPDKKEVLSKNDVEMMFQELSGSFCTNCKKCHECWQNNYFDTYKNTYDAFHAIEQDEVYTSGGEVALASQCINYQGLKAEMKRIFRQTKTNMLWYNRMIEGRTAVAVQLNEMAGMIREVADEIYQPKIIQDRRNETIRKKLKLKHIMVEQLTIVQKKSREEIYMTVHIEGKKCIPVRDVGILLSELCEKSFVPEKDSRLLLGNESISLLFVEEATYRVGHGVARAAKTGERISGDNFSIFTSEDGILTASLSDGMGSGYRANKESEMVIELLERFLEAGFCKETALSMMNATLVMNDQNGRYSTIDVVSLDLHDGTGEFVKLGGTYSFIKRENYVETIQMESMPIGLFQKQTLVKTQRKLYDGDYIVLLSDGVLSGIPQEEQVPLMEQLLMEMTDRNPKEIAQGILETMLREYNCDPADDMTVLVLGIWKK